MFLRAFIDDHTVIRRPDQRENFVQILKRTIMEENGSVVNGGGQFEVCGDVYKACLLYTSRCV